MMRSGAVIEPSRWRSWRDVIDWRGAEFPSERGLVYLRRYAVGSNRPCEHDRQSRQDRPGPVTALKRKVRPSEVAHEVVVGLARSNQAGPPFGAGRVLRRDWLSFIQGRGQSLLVPGAVDLDCVDVELELNSGGVRQDDRGKGLAIDGDVIRGN